MKRKHYLLIAALSLSLTTGAAAATMAACKDDPAVIQITENVAGTYYCIDENGEEKTIELGLNAFVLNFGEDKKYGFYSAFDQGTVTLLFDNSEMATAVFNSGILTLNYNGKTYEMFLKKDFTVSFDVDGGSPVAAQTVTNGKKATRPANDPTKGEGGGAYTFVGWYTDNTYTKLFDFDTEIITADITIYAKFIASDSSFGVYKAEFDAGEGVGAYPAIETLNRVLLNLPEVPSKDGNAFLGWWLSNYYDGAKLSTKYEGQEIFEDVVLYAVWSSDKPAVSVTPDGASWSVNGTNKTFDVAIKDSQGKTLKEQRSASTSIEFDFNEADAGDYTVEVTVDGQTTIAYYKNKALARVTKFTVEDDFFGFRAIEAEDKYLLIDYYMDLECGDAGHTHVHEKLGATGFNFANCPMKEGGLKFRITAEAVGYVSSVSEVFTLERSLKKVTNLTVDAEKDQVTWDAVENAKSYNLELSDGTNTIQKTVTETSFDLRSLNPANWTIKVTPFNYTYTTPEAEETTYRKSRLASPVNFTTTDTLITWDAVEGAKGYTLYVNGIAQSPDLTTNSFQIPAGLFDEEGKEFAVTVVALGATAAENSLASDALYIHGELGKIAYKNGEVSWDAVSGISKYGVKVGDDEEIFVTDGSNRANVIFKKSGATVITVTCYVNGNTAAGSNTETVDVYTVTFNTRGGSKVENQYKAAGDTLTLPEEKPTRLGYEFLGWYDKEENGAAYDNNKPFDTNKPTVYAHWKANTYTISLVVGADGAFAEETQTEYEVVFGEKFEFPAPECKLEGKEFMGWFTAANGGTQMTDNLGFAQTGWNIGQNATLYAQWGNSGVEYELNTNKKEYIAKKGRGVNNLSTVTVLATYNGLPVTMLMGNAFDGCSSIKKLRLPSSMKTFVIPDSSYSGPYSNGSSFYGMNGLEEVEVYDAGGERFIESVNGALYTVENEELNELIFVPKGQNKAGTFTVAEGTKSLAKRVLTGFNEIEEVVIPSSVTYIGSGAFASDYKLSKVTFLPAANGELGEALEVMDSFTYCSVLTEITFPKRLASISTEAFNSTSSSSTPIKNIYVQELGATKDRNTNYYDLDGVLCKADELVLYPYLHEGKSYQTPSGIARIGEHAFKNNKNITTIKFIATIEKIGAEAFSGCSNLKTLNFDQHKNNKDLEICEKAFSGCGLESVTLPPNLKKLGAGAFGDMSSLTSVRVESNRTNIDYANGAFAYIKVDGSIGSCSVTDLYLGDEVQELSISGVFGTELKNVEVSGGNPYYYSNDNVIYDKAITKILFFPDNKTEFVIDDNLKKITAGTFKGKTSLTSIVIGTGVTEIEDSAFEGCEGLTSIVFKAGGTESLKIGNKAFYKCGYLTKFEFNGRGGEEITIGDRAFEQSLQSNAQVENVVDTLTLPEGVTSIGKFAFGSSSGLKIINLPASLKEIKLLEIGDYFPSKITSIGVANVTAFYNCTHLQEINVAEGSAYFASVDGVLYGKEENLISTLYYVPKLAKCGAMPDEFKDPEGEEEQYGYLQVPETVTKVADFALNENYFIKRVKFTGSHASFSLGNSVFKSLSALEYVNLPSGITEVGEGLFASCSKLTQVEIPNTVTLIRQKAFKGCRTLKTVSFEEGNDEAKLVLEDGTKTSTSGGGEPTYETTGAFFNCPALEEIKFPARLQSIGNYSFYVVTDGATKTTSNLNKVEIPVTATKIGDFAFTACNMLDSVTFTGTLPADAENMTIGIEAFRKSGIQTIDLPDNVTEIGNYAFAETQLTELSVPAGVETLGKVNYNSDRKTAIEKIIFETTEVDGKQVSKLKTLGVVGTPQTLNSYYATFQNMTSLKTIVGLEYCTSLTELPVRAFMGTGLTSVKIPAHFTAISESAFENCTNLSSITFLTDESGKSSVASIGNYAFRNTALESFTFPTLKEGDLTLGNNLFEGCAALTDLTVSASVQDIGGALAKAPNLKNIVVEEGAGVYIDATNKLILAKTSEENNFYRIASAFGAVKLDANGKCTLPSSFNGGTITEIGDGVFAGQNAVRTFVIPETIQSIGASAFSQCRGLVSVEFAGTSTLTSIGAQAFEYTYLLDEIRLPDSVTSIGYRCFNTSGIKKIRMPNELKTAYKQIFYGCKRLETVENLSKMTGLSAAKGDGDHEMDGSQMFYNCYALTNVTLAEGVDVLPSQLFFNCTALETIDLTGVKSFAAELGSGTSGVKVASGIFYGCTALREVTLDAGLTVLPAAMFKDCKSLTTVYRSDTAEANRVEKKVDLSQITNFDKKGAASYAGAFDACSSIAEVDIRNASGFGADTVQIFRNCAKLKTVLMAGSGYTSLVDNMFEGCTSLKTIRYWNGGIIGNDNEVVFHDNIQYMGKSTFKNSGIEKITLPANLNVIGTNASTCTVSADSSLFYGCTQLKEVILPSGLTKIGKNVFYGCEALDTIKVRFSSEVQGEDGKITLPTGLEMVGDYCFMNCKSITAIDLSKVTEIGTAGTGKTATGLATGGLFFGCESLASVKLNDDIQLLGAGMFGYCTSLKTIDLPADLRNTNIYTFSGSGLTSITLPKGVQILGGTKSTATTISETANCFVFTDCAELETVTVSENFKNVGKWAFLNCGKLKSFLVEKDETTQKPKQTMLSQIGLEAFKGCASLETIDLSKVTVLGKFPFAGCTSLKEAKLSSATDTTLKAEKYSSNWIVDLFDGCSSLETVDLGNITTLKGAMFRNCTSLKEINLKNVTNPSQDCFYGCTSLKKITFGKCKTIAQGMFWGCTGLEEVDLTGITTINPYAFQGCTALTSVKFGDCTKVGNYMFWNCTSLASVDLTGVTSVGANAFQACTNLGTVTFDAALSAIGNYAFEGCTKLSTIYKSDVAEADREQGKADLSGLTSIGTRAFANCSALTQVVLNDNMTSIGDTAFAWTGLETINMPSKLESIQNQAFLSCSNLTSLEIPAGVTSLGTNLFIGCNNLQLTVAAGNEKFAIVNGWLVDKTDSTVLFIPPYVSGGEGESTQITEVNFAAGTKLYGYMFNGYGAVEKITLPSDLTEIPNYAFWNFKGNFGADFAIPAGVTSIGNGAFQQCENLTEIVIPEGVTSIGNNAFASCPNLTKITFPSTLRSIGNNAFDGCTMLSTIVFPTTPAAAEASDDAGLTIGSNAFLNCAGLSGSISLPDGIVSIGANAFQGCSGITGLEFGALLSSVGANAFQDCAALETVTFKDGLTALGANAFQGCAALREVHLGAGLTTIVASLFEGLANLESVNIPYTVKTIGASAFNGCVKLSSVTFDETPDGTDPVTLSLTAGGGSLTPDATYYFVDEFGVGYKGVFGGCTALKSISLPSRMTSIPTYAFVGSGLETITLPASVTSIGAYSFMYSALKNIAISYTVTSIGNTAFGGCKELTGVTFEETPEGVESKALELTAGTDKSSAAVGCAYFDKTGEKYYGGVFVGCTKLGEVNLPARATLGKYAFAFSGITKVNLGGIKSIPDSCFLGCSRLTDVVMPEGTTSLASNTFKRCSALANINIAETVTTLNTNCFEDCTSLMQLVLPITVKCSNNAFLGWTKDQKVLINVKGSELNATASTALWADGVFTSEATFGITGVDYASDSEK